MRGDDESGGKGMSRTLRPRCKSRERPPEPTVGQKKLYRWYSNWKILQFTCEHCGWIGKGEEAFPNEGGVLECPRCDRGVAYVQFPSLRDTEQAAAAGNEEAIRDLSEKRERIRRLEARMNKFWSNHLHSLEQLPELEGDESLEFTWDIAVHVGDENEDYQIIRVGEREVWRELAFWDNMVRFNEIKDLLKRKYGTRFKSLTPTDGSLDFLTGDHYFKLRTLIWT
jgi:hypothetical protein